MSDAAEPEPDFAAAGLLDPLVGAEREARLELLRRLHADGCSIDELREAAHAERLAILPVERLLRLEQCHSLVDAARETGLSLEYLRRNHRTLGLPRVDDDEPVYDDLQLGNLRVVAGLLESGMPEEDVLEMGRTLGHAGRRSAEALVDRLTGFLLQAGDTERDIALRYAEFAEGLLPVVDRFTGAALRLHLLDVIRQEAIRGVERESGKLAGARDVAVGFADLAGFTLLSEQAGVEEVGSLAGRFEQLVGDAAEAPVHLVKLLGDGAMLVSDDPDGLLDALLRIRDGAGDEHLPPVHAGMAFGPALRSSGDWYGHTVNLAARLCDAAERDTVLVTADVAERLGPGFRCVPHGARALKGVEGPVTVLLAERAPAPQAG